MPIIPRLDRVMADRKMSVNELSQRIDISPVNISRMRRITGYLTGSLESWNSAKQAEERDRVKHR